MTDQYNTDPARYWDKFYAANQAACVANDWIEVYELTKGSSKIVIGSDWSSQSSLHAVKLMYVVLLRIQLIPGRPKDCS